MTSITSARKNRLVSGKAWSFGSIVSTAVVIIGALYCFIPILWVIVASTKTSNELFTTFTFAIGTGLVDNLRDLFQYGHGAMLVWAANSVLYAGGGALACTFVSAAAGYGMAKFSFGGKKVLLGSILAGVLVPGVMLAIPQYLLLSAMGMSNTYLAVLLPSVISPFAIYLAWIFAAGSIPSEMLESARIDGAGEFRIFFTIGLRMMTPGLVTIFLLQFVAIWNNFLLPFIMLSNDRLYPITLGLYTMLNRGATQSALYTLTIAGAAVSVIPLVILMVILQRFWRVDLLSGGLKG